MFDFLVIDFDGDGLELMVWEGFIVFFDLDEDGFVENIGWVVFDDGLLVIDCNGNGWIDDIFELFGLMNMVGFLEFVQFDINVDGKIILVDVEFVFLIVWQDVDGDGVIDLGELKILDVIGIIFIDFNLEVVNEIVNGNRVVVKGFVEFSDGWIMEVLEVLFDVDQVKIQFLLLDDFFLDLEIYLCLEFFGVGMFLDLCVVMIFDLLLKSGVDVLIVLSRFGDFDGFFS